MRLKQAIKDLQVRVDDELFGEGLHWDSKAPVDDCADIKLGMEALKRLRETRRIHRDIPHTPLPGETYEAEEGRPPQG